jgi:spoIIIJ-associated protein
MKYQGKSMPLEKKDFYGKEVTDAIKKACAELGVTQEKLNIEVVETGSTGIFGLIRKKAHIKVSVKPDTEEEQAPLFEERDEVAPPRDQTVGEDVHSPTEQTSDEFDKRDEDFPENGDLTDDENVQISPENLEIVKNELSHLLELMGYPSEVQIESSGIAVHCCIHGGFDEALTGQDGKTLDSLQYILRKIIARKTPDRIRLSINIGDFRERRQQELAEKAKELARMVKEDGKTQMLPALNPSERRVVHMTLQEDKEIRSRSVGEGLFKKVLIYKPGKGKKQGARKHNGARGSKAKNGKPDTEK